MYLIIIILPLISGVVNGLIGRKIGKGGSAWVVRTSITICTLLSIIGFYEILIRETQVVIEIMPMISTEKFDVTWSFGIDTLTVIIYMPIIIVSLAVQIYSIEYMREDPHSIRYNSIISLFTFFMLVLVSGINWIIIYIGWEGVGVCSYLLINHWFKRNKANKAGIKAIIINRIGDWAIMIGIIIISIVTGNIEISTMNSLGSYINKEVITIIGLLVLIGAMCKSSQFMLHTWLPSAMEGPTPVSALIHAATLVTAGVYILIRISPILEYSKETLIIITGLGGITTIVAGIIGVLQKDIKRIIAYSTMSQLGYMVLAIGISEYELSIYHLINHGYYKGLLFISVGVIIHTMNDEQDIRRLGGLIRRIPFTYVTILIGSLSLMGMPYLTGNYSKELIIEMVYNHNKWETKIGYILGILSVVCTTIYTIKILRYGLIEVPRTRKVLREKVISEPPIGMYLPMIILSILSIINGYMVKDMVIGIGSKVYGNSILTIPMNRIKRIEIGLGEIISNTEWYKDIIIKNIPIIIIIGIIIINIVLVTEKKGIKVYNVEVIKEEQKVTLEFKKVRRIIEYIIKGMEIDNIYNNIVIRNIYKLGKIIGKRIDKGILEIVIAYRMIKKIKNISKEIGNWDKGKIYYLIINILLGVLILENILILEIIIIITIVVLKERIAVRK